MSTNVLLTNTSWWPCASRLAMGFKECGYSVSAIYPQSVLLRTSFCDVPWQEPDLVQDLLRVPWPDRSLLAHLSNQLRRTTFQDRHSRGGVFQPALAGREPADEHRVET